MFFRKLIGVMLVVFFGFFILVSGMALVETPEIVEKMEDILWLGDCRYDPANEGKLIAVSLSLSDLGNAVDPEIGLEFTTPAVHRIVEYFDYDGIKYGAEWVRIEKADNLPLWCTAFAGKNGGAQELELADVFSPMLPSGRDLDVSDLTPESQDRILSLFETVISQGRVYFSNASPGCFMLGDEDRDDPPEHLMKDHGMIRVRYTAPFDSGVPIVVVGIQQGTTLIKDEDLGIRPVFEGEKFDSLEAVITDHRNTVLFGAPAIILVCGLCVFQGLRMMGIVKWEPKFRKKKD